MTTAYYLQRLGHDVTVVDRQPGAALETSFGNGAIIHASEVEPWSQPGMPRKILGWIGREDAPMLLRAGALPHVLRWGAAFLANCTSARFRANSETNLKLALYSLRSLQEIQAEEGISYDRSTQGVLKIFRDRQSYENGRRNSAHLAPLGLVFGELSGDAAVAAEPALADTGDSLFGALFYPRDEIGDCHKFCTALADVVAKRGGKLLFETSVTELKVGSGRIVAVDTDKGSLRADSVIVAMGSFTPRLLAEVGLKPLIYPVKGVSVTVDKGAWNSAPKHAVIDDGRMFGLIPIGDRLRAAGSAEIARYDATPSPLRAAAIIEKVLQTFPAFAHCYQPETAKVWAGLRPVSPSGLAYMGQTPIANLYVNAGHGHLGWTMSCGAGRYVADIVAGRPPEIALPGLPQL
jgi:D-amino-acid dehydrogenase